MAGTTEYRSFRLATNPTNATVELILGLAWIGFAKANLLRKIWPGRPMLLSEFLQWCNQGHVYATVIGADESFDVAGLGWVNSLDTPDVNRGYRAEVGMAFLPSFQGSTQTLEMAKFMIQDGFDNLAISDMRGVIPVDNLEARSYARRMGFVSAGVKKGLRSFLLENGAEVQTDCEIFEISKEAWYRKQAEGRIADILKEPNPLSWVPQTTPLKPSSN